MRETNTSRKPRFYTAEDAWLEIGCSRRTFYRITKNLNIKSVQMGRTPFFLPDQVETIRSQFTKTSRTRIYERSAPKSPRPLQFWSFSKAAAEAGCSTEEFFRTAEHLNIKPADLKTGLYFLWKQVRAVKDEVQRNRELTRCS